MTARELMEGCYKARSAFNTYGSILRRSLDWRANCRTPYHAAAYWLANLTSRREIHRKQGRALGDYRMPLRPVYPRGDAQSAVHQPSFDRISQRGHAVATECG
jgi:hypothetical protein